MKRFFRQFYDLSVYAEQISQRMLTVLGRFMLVYLVTTFIFSAAFVIKLLPDLKQFTTSISDALEMQLPKNASVAVSQGELVTKDLPLPFAFTLVPKPLANDAVKLIQIDNRWLGEVATDSGALIIMARDGFQIREFEGEAAQVVSYRTEQVDFGEFRLSKITEAVAVFKSFIDNKYMIIPFILWPFMLISSVMSRFLEAFVYALMLWLGAKLFGGIAQFRSLLKLTLSTVYVAEIVNLLVYLIYGQFYSIVFSFTYIGLTMIVYLNLKAKKDIYV